MSANKLYHWLAQLSLKTLFIKFLKATGVLLLPKKHHYKFIMIISGSICGFRDASELNFKANDIQTSNNSWENTLQFAVDQINHHSRLRVLVCDSDLGLLFVINTQL